MKQYAVIGLGSFGNAVAKTLAEMGHEVLAVDKSEEKIHEISDFVTHAVAGDITDVHVLNALGLSNFDAVVIAIGTNLQASILATVMCKEAGAKMIVAKAQNDVHKKVLEKIGADRVIFPEDSMGKKIAVSLASPSIMELVDIAPEVKIAEITVFKDWYGKTLVELDLRNRKGINILMIKRGNEVFPVPSADFRLQEGDFVIVCGSTHSVKNLTK